MGSKIKDITWKSVFNLIPRTQADLLHLTICYIVFRTSIDILNNSGIALLITVLVASLKEFNDQFGIINKFLSDGKTRTGFSGRDWWIGLLIPFILTILQYNNIINIL